MKRGKTISSGTHGVQVIAGHDGSRRGIHHHQDKIASRTPAPSGYYPEQRYAQPEARAYAEPSGILPARQFRLMARLRLAALHISASWRMMIRGAKQKLLAA
jgi:hypothetical protein